MSFPLYRHSTSYLRLIFLGLLFCSLIGPNSGWCRNTFETHFAGTDYELNVYKIRGKSPGKTILIIGGIQGNEPGGFMSADLYADMILEKGNLIVVPRANFYSILLNRRQVNEDMNRKFSEPSRKNYEAQVVSILKRLITESDCLLNLHDGSGFYADTWQSPLRNPKRFGQSIIADCETHTNPGTGKILKLKEAAEQVISEINSHIKDTDHLFHFNNHRTNAPDTPHPEQRKSATYYALYKCGIPAFGIETSKSLPLERRIYHHNLAINAFMKILGVEPEVPGIILNPPTIKYVVVKVNDQAPIVVANGETLNISPGDVVKVIHLESNYERGLSADIAEYGTINDINKSIAINHPTQIMIRKDHLKCGKINIALTDSNKPPKTITTNPHVVYFKIKINGEEKYFPNGAHVNIIRGDTVELVDVGTIPESTSAGIIVNFKGFVGNDNVNTGEDRGYIIHTDRDLWKRYSLYKNGRLYQAVVTKNNDVIGRLFIDIEEPTFEYVVIQLNDMEKRCFFRDDILSICHDDIIKLIDIKTNVPKNLNVIASLNGHGVKIPLPIGKAISAGKITPVSRITINRANIPLGSILLDIKETRLTRKSQQKL
ncbi:MAG: M14/M99 family metallopeptidase [Syntrophales bacterium]|nr:M14/M99 family metallopeptidase [Syntrophales bacterium]